MQLLRYVLNTNSVFLLIYFVFSFSASAALFEVEYLSGKVVTISAGDELANHTVPYTYCGSLNYVTLTISTNGDPTNSSGKTVLATTKGNSSSSCTVAISSELPVTTTYSGTISYICFSGGTLLDRYKSGHCSSGSDINSSVEGVTCTISSGDINHEYETILSDEVDGKSITTTGTLTCSGGSNGSTSVSLGMNDYLISLNDDDSLNATLTLDGAKTSKLYDITNNSSTNFTLTSTLNTNGNVSSGAFSGSSVLTLSYY